MMFEPVKNKGVGQKIAEQIERLVLRGDLQPGDKLPTEKRLAEQFEVSRAPVREALSTLQMAGIIERKKGHGTYIRDLNLREVLDGLVFSSSDKELFMDVLEVREILEGQAVALAADRGTQDDFLNIETAMKVLEDSFEDIDQATDSDILFHLNIFAATHNEVLFRLGKEVEEFFAEVRKKTLSRPGRLEECIAEHREIFKAINKRDLQTAQEKVKLHLHKVKELVKVVREN